LYGYPPDPKSVRRWGPWCAPPPPLPPWLRRLQPCNGQSASMVQSGARLSSAPWSPFADRVRCLALGVGGVSGRTLWRHRLPLLECGRRRSLRCSCDGVHHRVRLGRITGRCARPHHEMLVPCTHPRIGVWAGVAGCRSPLRSGRGGHGLSACTMDKYIM